MPDHPAWPCSTMRTCHSVGAPHDSLTRDRWNATPDFRFNTWLANVEQATGLSIDDVVEPVIDLYNFQSWCPGCHSHGFPTMKAVKDHFASTGQADQVKFIAVQTVF
ncbi:MAG: hypothetical protein R2706_08240 [Acidimicrobiales bacterium]